MNKLILIICFFLLSCNSRTTNVKAIVDTSTKKRELTTQAVNNIVEIKKPANIFDTLVFNDNMKGEILSDKFKTSQSQLIYYRNFVNPKRINRLKIIKDKHTKTEIRYLGVLRDLDKINSYHVITNFQIWGIGQIYRQGKK